MKLKIGNRVKMRIGLQDVSGTIVGKAGRGWYVVDLDRFRLSCYAGNLTLECDHDHESMVAQNAALLHRYGAAYAIHRESVQELGEDHHITQNMLKQRDALRDLILARMTSTEPSAIKGG